MNKIRLYEEELEQLHKERSNKSGELTKVENRIKRINEKLSELVKKIDNIVSEMLDFDCLTKKIDESKFWWDKFEYSKELKKRYPNFDRDDKKNKLLELITKRARYQLDLERSLGKSRILVGEISDIDNRVNTVYDSILSLVNPEVSSLDDTTKKESVMVRSRSLHDAK